jgi:serine/threonine protein phosphatase 1
LALDFLLPRTRKVSPKTPDGVRIYAIGDVHGRADLLAQLFATIDIHNSRYPVAQSIEVLVGDYVDRGPQSREVLDLLSTRNRRRRLVCLKGNHETYISNFLQNPSMLSTWRQLGGFETLLSYGIRPPIHPDEKEKQEIATAFDRILPDDHRRFLTSLINSFACGDYFFVHAGVRPNVPLFQQNEEDLLSIREVFLRYNRAFGKIIIHGHTPVAEPDIRPNRINIDTGAYATGNLTCLVLHGEDMVFI